MTEATEKAWSARAPVLFGLFGLIVLFGGFALWATQTNIAGAIIASGRIEVDRNRQIVQHPTGGVVAEIAVQEGDTVKAGDLLLALDDRQAQSQLAIIEGQLYELMARRGRLEAERDQTDEVVFEEELMQAGAGNPDLEELISGQRNLFFARRDSVAGETEQLQKRQGQIQNQIDGIEAQEKALALQLGFIEEELASQQALLEKGLAQATRVLALQRQQASLDGQLGELAASKAQAEGRITEIDLEVLKLGAARREEAITRLRDLRYRELELVEQRASLLQDIDKLQIRAPVSGIVYAMRVQTPRSVIRGADPVLFLIPQDRPLVIVAQVDPIHIDEVHVGQQVNLRLSALDQRNTPELVGEVALISADAFEDETLGRTYYRAEITLNPGELTKLKEGDVLIPGMPVETFIRTADRTPMAYLIKPFADYFKRAFRET
ncbi:HlyD family secretion protein [Pseudosulfitobacter pseudonitzschiae]|uniref:Membrane fusion protein (MFP) family protein n=1 Tax=Pseudosulfitobacter pseudonitzschiae TaxID=1402135 RepID=A0A073IZ71_9RHOB|nr:HlyD family type I secretion periplasmic adaptor subunit [Pseudosulfitobacter pseudonitzschiae]KEJ94910.1 RTX toxin [Pseudosulfitobacter pseudonitzschiae]QKS07385.1 HlyD family type I secretion periplasmic adaptor subunit [Pseudosulfitobacter pseudonitzschiae]SHF96589.1 HlyD family secretion protein [Pseudosulfitobacter pseudonitzschiae]